MSSRTLPAPDKNYTYVMFSAYITLFWLGFCYANDALSVVVSPKMYFESFSESSSHKIIFPCPRTWRKQKQKNRITNRYSFWIASLSLLWSSIKRVEQQTQKLQHFVVEDDARENIRRQQGSRRGRRIRRLRSGRS
jgi:hypothetical protein